MSDLKKAAQAALEALEECLWLGDHPCRLRVSAAMAAIRAALAQPEAEPVARVAEVHMSRYTIEWTNGPLPEGTLLYAQQPTLAKPDQPTADGPTSDPGRSAPDLAASDRGLPEPAAYARWWEQNAYSVQQLECLRKLPEVEAYWKDRSKLALFTASQMLAFRAEGVAQERERCARVCEGTFGVNIALNDEEAYFGRQMANAIRKE